ncbi:MAG: hypothetical protein RI947_973 [Candidatus Parcubacteria bacterium]|jgi:magnesium transporter
MVVYYHYMGHDNTKQNNLPNKSTHQPETAAVHMTSNVPIALINETIAEVENTILKHSAQYDTIHYIYVVNDQQKLVGVMSVKELFRSPKSTKVEKVMNKEIVYVHPHTDQEHVAMKALHNRIKAIPVLDRESKLLGVVTSDKILEILHAEHTEDFLRIAGVHTFRDPAVNIINASAWVHIKKRLPWLVLGLMGGIVAATIVKQFEYVLEHNILLAAFIPSIVYLADAAGTQTETIFVRSMALDHNLSMVSYVKRELKVGLGIALFLGALASLIAFLMLGDSFFMYVIGLSVAGTILAATAIAMSLPYALTRFKVDPAMASGPFATVITDIVSLVIYFVISQSLFKLLGQG